MSRRNLDLSQTIFSLASGSLPCAVAILRLSGNQAFAIAREIFEPQAEVAFDRRREMWFGTLHDPETGSPFDKVLLLSFVAPHSFTGEDVIEIQCHGSFSVVKMCQEIFLSLGARPAEPGEFTYRALLNGKLSARDVEDLGDIFLAREKNDLLALENRREGSVDRAMALLRNHLIQVRAIFDTAVDFSEEYSSVLSAAREPIQRVIHECSAIIQRFENFAGVQQKPRLVLAGRTNAGKSSLFNALLAKSRAIVHERPGTTRDAIEEDFEMHGRSWKLVDTAGVRRAESGVEAEGIALGEEFLKAASLWVLVVDGSIGMSEAEIGLLRDYGHIPHLVVWNKKDRADWVKCATAEKTWEVSAKSGDGVTALWDGIKDLGRIQRFTDSLPLASATQVARLRFAVDVLHKIEQGIVANAPPEELSELSRQVSLHLESVSGEIGNEDVLDRVFGQFCIGK